MSGRKDAQMQTNPGAETVKMYRSKDCRTTMEHVQSVFCFGSENWPCSHATLDIIKGWETKPMRRLFRQNEEDEMWLTAMQIRRLKGGVRPEGCRIF